ncbi:MAG: hypothetical protein NTW15_21280, partial [Burkholderiales bacterium]|nr:hypothetical protein [Burkholderiales bacterium]
MLAPNVGLRARRQRVGWARLFERDFDIDLQRCPRCGAGQVKIISVILERAVIGKILTHLGLDPQPSPRSLGGAARDVRTTCLSARPTPDAPARCSPPDTLDRSALPAGLARLVHLHVPAIEHAALSDVVDRQRS